MNDLQQDCVCQSVSLTQETRADLEIGERHQADTQVKRLALFHYDPFLDDRTLELVLADTVWFEAISRRGVQVEVISIMTA